MGMEEYCSHSAGKKGSESWCNVKISRYFIIRSFLTGRVVAPVVAMEILGVGNKAQVY